MRFYVICLKKVENHWIDWGLPCACRLLALPALALNLVRTGKITVHSRPHLQVEDARPREGRAQVLEDDEPVGDVVRDVRMVVGSAEEKEDSQKTRTK